jgi:hypothetical protein
MGHQLLERSLQVDVIGGSEVGDAGQLAASSTGSDGPLRLWDRQSSGDLPGPPERLAVWVSVAWRSGQQRGQVISRFRSLIRPPCSTGLATPR